MRRTDAVFIVFAEFEIILFRQKIFERCAVFQLAFIGIVQTKLKTPLSLM